MSEVTTSEIFWRQMDLFNPDKYRGVGDCTIIGCGSIGSHIALILSKLGISRLALYDFDSVELHNLPNQLFRPKDIGAPKVEATKNIIEDYCPRPPAIQAFNVKYESQEFSTPIVISALDSHEARREIFKSVKSQTPMLYIDSRMGGVVGVIYCLDPAVRNNDYEASMGGAGEDLPCTARSIIFNVMYMAAMVASEVRNFLLGEPNPYKLAFSTNDFTILMREEP